MIEGFDVLTAISTVGFPIVACIALFYFAITMITEIKTMVSKNNETNAAIAETLKEVTEQITEIRVEIAKIQTKIEANAVDNIPKQ